MNSKEAKALRKRADEIIVEWLRTLVPEGEDRDRINVNNISEFLPEDVAYYANGQRRLHAMTPKYIVKALKKDPNVTHEDILDA